MLLFEMCHPPFGTKMERTVVLTNAHRLVFPEGDAWGPPKGQEAMKSLCRSMLQEDSAIRPSATEIVRQVWLQHLFDVMLGGYHAYARVCARVLLSVF